jgi:hypothetical protein
MTINPPRQVRVGIYLLTALGTPLIAYLAARGVIGDLEVALWSAEVTVASTLAALNTGTPPTRDERGAMDPVAAVVLVILCVAVAYLLHSTGAI